MDSGKGRPLEEVDFETSITALQSSTAAIDDQCSKLEAQLETMRELSRRNGQPVLPDTGSDVQSRQREATKLYAETDGLADSLKSRVTNLKRQTDASLSLLKSGAQRQLDKDDRLLDGLQKLMLNLEVPEPPEKQIEDVEKLAKALVSLQGTVVKNRANQIYLTTLESARKGSDLTKITRQPNDELKIAALAEELDSLIGEVDSVLEMVVDHQYRQPILNDSKASDVEAQRKRQQWLLYVQTALQQMTDRLQDLSSHTQDLHAYGIALESVSSILADICTTEQPATGTAVPVVSARPQHKAIRDLVLPATSNTHPALELLRHHGINLPTPSMEDDKNRAAVETAIQERKSRLKGLSTSTEQGISNQVSESVNMADAQLQGLLQAVYAYSPYRTVNLADEDIKARLKQLDKGIENLAGELRGLEPEKLIERERRQLDNVLSSRNDS